MESPTPALRRSAVQPWRGLFSLAVTFFLALVVTFSCSIDSFLGLVSVWIMCMVPIQLIMDIGWDGKYPPTDFLPQPWRGLALMLFMGLVGTVTAFAVVHMVGRHAAHPFVSVFVILTVVTAIIACTNFWLWPFDKWSPGAKGMIWAVLAPGLVFFITKLLDFSRLSFAPGGPQPFYKGGIPLPAPVGGPVLWESGLTWYLWLAFLSFTWALLDFWPFTKLKLMRQPALGLVMLPVNMILAFAIYKAGTAVLGLEPLNLMYCGISYAFGLLIVLVVFEKWPGRLVGGLRGGLLNLALSVLVGAAGYHLANAVCAWHFGPLPYPNRIFASATFMLGLNFPLWVLYCKFFEAWPLPPAAPGGK